MKRRFPLLALLLLSSLASYAFGSAQYQNDYAAGFNATEKGDWNVVAAKMRAAIGGKPQEGGKVLLYGMNYVPYFPHYFLGIALAKTGNCAEAVKELAESERQGAIRSSKYYSTLTQTLQGCGGSEPVKPPPSGPNPQILALARQGRSEIEAARRSMKVAFDSASTTEAWGKDPSFDSRRRDAERAIDTAENRIQDGEKKGDAGILNAAIDAAKNAASQAEAIRQAAVRAQQDLDARQAKARQDEITRLDAAKKAAGANDAAQRQLQQQQQQQEALRAQQILDEQKKERDQQARELALTVEKVSRYLDGLDADSRSPALEPQLNGLKASLRKSQLLASSASSADSLRQSNRELMILRDEFAAALRRSGGKKGEQPPAAEPPARLYLAATAFLQGDYPGVIRELDATTFTDRKEMLHSLTFRAASYHALYVLGNVEPGVDYLRLALADVRACRRLDPAFSPSVRAFSPRFRDFFLTEKP